MGKFSQRVLNQSTLLLAATSVEEIFPSALVNVANRYQSGETPDSPQPVKNVEEIHVKSTLIVVHPEYEVNRLIAGLRPSAGILWSELKRLDVCQCAAT